MKLRLPAKPPFSLPAVVGSHGWIRLSPFSEIDGTGSFKYIDRLASGRVVELLVREAPGGVDVASDADLDESEKAEIAQKAQWMLALDMDFSTFYDLARDEPKLAKAAQGAKGRVLRSPSLFEDTVKTILTTNTTWGGTIRMVEALVSQFGTELPADQSGHAFPAPEQLAAADVETLRNQTRLGYRAPYVLELAQSIARGEVDLEALKNSDLPTLELRKELLALKGVGDYAAANLLMLLGRYDYIPVDSWALKMVSYEWFDGEPIGRRQVEEAFQRWENWQGLAFWFWDWSYSSGG